jgi:hypothetical protein
MRSNPAVLYEYGTSYLMMGEEQILRGFGNKVLKEYLDLEGTY